MKVRLIDGSGFIVRGYFALPPMQRSDGLPCNAVHGFCETLWRLSQFGGCTHLAVVFDASSVTFRNQIYPLYKANRPEKPADMVPQFPLMRDAARAFNIASTELEGYEADDLIATYTRIAAEAGAEVEIVTADKDMMQLVGGPVTIWNPFKRERIGPQQVEEKFGVPPERVLDVLALMGDSSDNIPGVPKIGIKTAAKLIREFGDLDTLLANAHQVSAPKIRENLIRHAEDAILSRQLVRLEDNVPVEEPLEAFERRPVDPHQMSDFLHEMEFVSLAAAYTAALVSEAA